MTHVPGFDGVLAAVGVHPLSEQLYREVLRRPGATIESLADSHGKSVPDTLVDLATLVERNLVRRVGDVVLAEPPEFALGRLLTAASRRLADVESALDLAQDQMHTFVAEHRAGQSSEWRPVSLEVVPVEDVGDVMETLIEMTTGELRFLRRDQWQVPTGVRADVAVAVAAAVAHGRRSRVIYPSDIDVDSPSLQRRAAAGEDVRVLPEVPSRLAIFGSESALLPEIWGTTAAPLLIRQPALVAACVGYFDLLWGHATPMPGYGGGVGGSTKGQLLELLAQGAKDEQIARSMSLSLRTVRRRIADLMAELGVDSRFQAGMEAVRRGWL